MKDKLSISLATIAALIAFFPYTAFSLSQPIVAINFSIIAFGATYFLFKDNLPWSINQMVWIFTLFFFSIIPSVQFRLNAYPWDWHISEHFHLTAQTLILITTAVYYIVYKIKPKQSFIPSQSNDFTLPSYAIYVFYLAVLILVSYIGIENLWIRKDLDAVLASKNHTEALIVVGVCRALILVYTIYTVQKGIKQKINRNRLFVILVLFFICNFPLALNRIYTALCYGSLLLSINSIWIKRKFLFRIFILVSLIIIYPLGLLLRFDSSLRERYAGDLNKYLSTVFIGGDFDAYSNLTHTLKYIEQFGITSGRQLISAVLFFIPRSIWNSKSIGSGMYVSDKLYQYPRNISSPLIAEGLINFNYLGALIFMIILGIIAKGLDKFHQVNRDHSTTLMSIFYPITIFITFYFLRGDLMSSIALGSTFLIVYMLIKKINLKRFK